MKFVEEVENDEIGCVAFAKAHGCVKDRQDHGRKKNRVHRMYSVEEREQRPSARR